MIHEYLFSVFGLRVSVRARSLADARSLVLRRWLLVVAQRASWPLVPVIVLLGSSDIEAQSEVADGRVQLPEVAPIADAEDAIVYLLGLRNREVNDK